MRINIPKDWCIRMAHLEGGDEVGVGDIARDPHFEDAQPSSSNGDPNIAFGRFVQLLRRARGFTKEQLTSRANIDLGELVRIEDDVHHKPDLRTVYQLALFFRLDRQKLMQLAGLAIATDTKLHQAAERFAARSDPVASLTEEERNALDAFVQVLSERE